MHTGFYGHIFAFSSFIKSASFDSFLQLFAFWIFWDANVLIRAQPTVKVKFKHRIPAAGIARSEFAGHQIGVHCGRFSLCASN